jgi:hypothetical protein
VRGVTRPRAQKCVPLASPRRLSTKGRNATTFAFLIPAPQSHESRKLSRARFSTLFRCAIRRAALAGYCAIRNVHFRWYYTCKQTNKQRTGRKMGFEKKEVTFRQVTKEKRDPTLPYGHLSLRRRRESEEKEKVGFRKIGCSARQPRGVRPPQPDICGANKCYSSLPVVAATMTLQNEILVIVHFNYVWNFRVFSG